MTAPQEPERAIKAMALLDKERGFRVIEAPFSPLPGLRDECWIVLAPHDQPPVPAAQHEREVRAAIEFGFRRGRSVGLPVTDELLDCAVAAWKAREG